MGGSPQSLPGLSFLLSSNFVRIAYAIWRGGGWRASEVRSKVCETVGSY